MNLDEDGDETTTESFCDEDLCSVSGTDFMENKADVLLFRRSNIWFMFW